MSHTTASSDRSLTASREVAASLDLVFAAHRDPSVLAQWWGPDGFTNTFDVFEFRTGGRWIFVMHGPDGTNYKNESVFEEITEPTKLVINHVCWPEFRLTITLTGQGSARTHVAWTQTFASLQDYEKLRAVCVEANQQNFNRLETALQAMA